MSSVSTKYSATASQNTQLGKMSLKENETQFRDINNLFRQIMADARVESNEVRALIESARNAASSASDSATTARGEVNEINLRIAGIQDDVSDAASAAGDAQNAAEVAASNAQTAANSATQAVASLSQLQTTVSGLQTSTNSLSNRLTTLENASAQNSGTSLVDDTTIKYLEGDLTAVDIAIDEDKTDLASGRGQIGRTAVKTSTQETPVDLGDIVLDGWYAVGGVEATGLPTGVTSGILRVSSAYAEGSLVQCLWTGSSETCRAFMRWSNGTNWSDWLEQMSISSLGNGLAVDNNTGVVSVDFTDVLPEATDDDSGKVLSADGVWVDRVTQEQLDSLAESVSELSESMSSLKTDLEAVQATVAVEPDGTTIAVTDGSLSVPLYLGATEEEDGIAGLVPAAESADMDKYLRGDGTWADPAMEPPSFDGESAGLVPAPDEIEIAEGAEDNRYLKHDGTWDDPCESLAERVAVLEEESGIEALMERVVMLENGATNEEIDFVFWPPSESEPEEQGGGE